MTETRSPELHSAVDMDRRSLRVVLAYNPHAGSFSAARLRGLRKALKHAGHRVTLYDSLDVSALSEPDQIDVVCVIGGDGTVRTVVDQCHATARDTAFCVYPAGTINLIAREAGYPVAVEAFAQRLTDDTASAQHFLGKIDDQVFLCCASVGPDSAAVSRVTATMKRRFGRLAYVIALLGLIHHWPRQRITVTIDGESHTAEAAYICKGRYYAGPWMIDDQARLGSDHFRVVLLDRARRRDLLRLALSAIISPRLADPRWLRLTAADITIAADSPLPIQADGDILATTPATIAIVPEPVQFL